MDSHLPAKLTLYHTTPTFNDPEKKEAFENIVGKGEKAGNQHFLLFPQCFLPSQKQFLFLRCNYFVICECFEFRQVQYFVSMVKR